MAEAPIFTRQQKLAEVRREIAQRRQVYPRMVSKGTMRQGEADHLIALMEDIARDYERALSRAGGAGR